MAIARPSRVGVVGVSIDDPCGVRDHAALLAEALTRNGVACSSHWLQRSETSLGGARSEVGAWARSLAGELQRERPVAVLLHYSVFALAHRGVPLLVRPVLSALRASRVPLVTFMHEYAYPWNLGAARTKVWAATQRLALIDVAHASTSLVVSADDRARWLGSRPWLPRRPISVAPVFSNLPPPAASPQPGEVGSADPAGGERIGLFGYAHEGVAADVVLQALQTLRAGGRAVELELLGAPGSSSPAGARWLQAAERAGVAEALGFSERLPAQQLSDELARCKVLLFAERGGPTARKTTLAASLSSGRPVVALDGPNSWSWLVQSGAAVVVSPDARALADAVAALLGDGDRRTRQAELGRAFARDSMSLDRSAEIVGDALASAIATGLSRGGLR